MKMARRQRYLPLIAGIVGLTSWFAAAQEESEALPPMEDDLAEIDTTAGESSLSDTYQVIVDRNPFNLQPPAPPAPPKVEEEAPKEEVSLKELNIVLAGVSAKNGDKRVWLSMTLPPTQPEQKPVERFFGFRENDQQHGITVKSIQSNGNVDIVYDGTPVLLSFETHGNKKKATSKSKTKPKTNVRTARSTSVPNRSVSARTGNTRSSTSSSRAGTSNRSNVASGSRSVPVGRSTSTARTIPARPVRTQQQPQLSRDEQITLIQTQKAIAEQEGRPFPPLPPLRR